MKEDAGSEFCILDKRMLFTLCLEMRESGINCWDKDLLRYIFSSRIDEYHPMREYFGSLPQWDGRQRVMPLIQRITDVDICCNAMFRCCFGRGRKGCGKWLNINEIIELLKSAEPEVMRRVNQVMMGRELTAAGVEKEHRRDGNYYLVVRK